MMPAMIGTWIPARSHRSRKSRKVAVVEEKLGHNVVRAGIDLLLEVIHFQEPVWRGRMAFGKSRDANAKPTPVGVNLPIVELPNESHKVGRMLEVVISLAIFQSPAEGRPPSERMLLTPARA